MLWCMLRGQSDARGLVVTKGSLLPEIKNMASQVDMQSLGRCWCLLNREGFQNCYPASEGLLAVLVPCNKLWHMTAHVRQCLYAQEHAMLHIGPVDSTHSAGLSLGPQTA